MIASEKKALCLLKDMGASEHLLNHVRLVGEAAQMLLHQCEKLNVPIDSEFVKMAVVIHDAGKIVHPHEMSAPGSNHEPAGEKMLLKKGISPTLARCCLSHARWQDMECSLEELILAVADTLWKGKRIDSLELRVIDHIAGSLKKDRWDVFPALDSLFEAIANDGDNRLSRSKGG
ncbi:HD domain-containing protein [Desulfoluna spongiiphila]|uniref:HD domain-containing protein n=1 Tax=Desulfoluna spongiiphila TaxID=419481 RepID=UPI001D002908|nr:HD domain-containing protein [Desulfoluna spongiiphila]